MASAIGEAAWRKRSAGNGGNGLSASLAVQ
jgi:hypothetical protein